jgi:hypothetical protein
MGYGGIPTYYGPTGDAAYSFFGSILTRANQPHKRVDNPRDMFDMLNVRERLVLDEMRRADPNANKQFSRTEAAKGWRGEFFRPENPLFQQMYGGRRAIGNQAGARGVPGRAGVAVMRQFGQ